MPIHREQAGVLCNCTLIGAASWRQTKRGMSGIRTGRGTERMANTQTCARTSACEKGRWADIGWPHTKTSVLTTTQCGIAGRDLSTGGSLGVPFPFRRRERPFTSQRFRCGSSGSSRRYPPLLPGVAALASIPACAPPATTRWPESRPARRARSAEGQTWQRSRLD